MNLKIQLSGFFEIFGPSHPDIRGPTVLVSITLGKYQLKCLTVEYFYHQRSGSHLKTFLAWQPYHLEIFLHGNFLE